MDRYRSIKYPVWVKYNGEVSKILVEDEESIVNQCWEKISANSRVKQTAKFNGRSLDYEEKVVSLNTTEDNPMEFFKGDNIMAHGLPPMTQCGCNSAYTTPDHDPAKLIELEVGMPFLESLECEEEMSLFDPQRINIIAIRMFGVPIGVVVVKKPGSSSRRSLDDEKVIGQIYDYLKYIKTYTGSRHPIGILTSYYNWRVVWLSESNGFASSPTPSYHHSSGVRNPSYKITTEVPDWSKSQEAFVCSVYGQQSSGSFAERKLIGTPLIKWNDPDLLHFLISALFKMTLSPVDSVQLSTFDKGRSYIYVRKEEWSWDEPTQEGSLRYCDNRLPQFQNVDLFLLADLGGGADGRVWLAATMKGEVFVIKFSKDEVILEQEADIWKRVWRCDARVLRLNGRYGLAMPWVKPCDEADFENKEIQEAIKESVRTLASAGYRHDDLRRRHVGLYKTGSVYKAVLFDLAHVLSVNKEAVEESVVIMMKDLSINL
uniref:DUF5898 domain-containing protein n=1 Tax=Amphimedon queenslandica TaxID=400682 RepID=A0A1X7UMG5_AMPQE